MKSRNFIFTFIFSIISLVCFSQNAWERITPAPQEHTIHDICKIPGTDKIMAVGSNTTVMITSDLGQNWDIRYNPANLTNDGDLLCIHFLNEDVGFIGCSSTVILKTTDGGETWQTTYKSNIKSSGIKSIDFVNENVGFAVGLYSNIFKTEDGGDNWFLFETTNDIDLLNEIAFVDELTGYIVGFSSDSIVKTTDGGETWFLEEFPLGIDYGNLTGICFVNESVGFITSQALGISYNYGHIYKTDDAGVTWTIVYEDNWNMPVDIQFLDENTGIAGCSRIMYESSVLITHDAGETWAESIFQECSSFGAGAVFCNTEDSYLVAGNMGFIYAKDGSGTAWELLHDRIFTGDISQAQVFDEENVFALAQDGLGGVLSFSLRKSNDGGVNWNYLSTFLGPCVFDFVTPQLGYVVVNDYELRILKTINGGNDWSELAVLPGFNIDPFWCNFKDELNGIFSDGNTIFITEDGGYSWNDISIPGPLLLDAEYIGGNKIIMLANDWDQTYIYTSNDNGMTWEGPVNISWNYASGLYVNDLGTIYVPGLNSILKSTDGGDSWMETTIIGSGIFFNSIHFPTDEIGYAVGYGSYKSIFKSTDGGNTWNELDINSTSTLNHVHFFDDEYGLVFGDNGLVMKTTTGGTVGFEEICRTSNSNGFYVYPNPVTDEVYFEAENVENGEVKIYDQSGKLVHRNSFLGLNSKQKIGCKYLDPGLYYLKFTFGNFVETKKIIKL